METTTQMEEAAVEEGKKKRAYGTGGKFKRVNVHGEATWYIAYRVNGKPIRESTRSSREADAERLLQKRMGEVQDGEIACSPLRVKVVNLLDDLVDDYKVRDLSSLKTVTTHIEGEEYGLRKMFGQMKAKAVTKPVLNKAVVQWQAIPLMPATINKHLATLRRAFTLAVENRKIGKGLVPDFPHLPENNARQTYIGVADMTSIIAAMKDDGTKDFVAWLYNTSQRWGEVASMTWDMFNRATWDIRIPGKHTKNGEPRVIPVAAVEDLRPILERRLAARCSKCPYIFHRNGKRIHPSWLKMWRKGCGQVGFIGKRHGGITPHDLRHIAATDLLEAGVSETIIMQIGGWETAAMFRRYAIKRKQPIVEGLNKLSAHRKQAAKAQPAKIVPMPNVAKEVA